MLIKERSKLMVRSYELSVLVTPQLEEAYRNHPSRGFSCAPVHGQVSVTSLQHLSYMSSTAAAGSAMIDTLIPLSSSSSGALRGLHSEKQHDLSGVIGIAIDASCSKPGEHVGVRPLATSWQPNQLNDGQNVEGGKGCQGQQQPREHAGRTTQIEFWAFPAAAATASADPRHSSASIAYPLDDKAPQGLSSSAVKLYIPLPFDVPPRRYDAYDQPWTNDTLHEGFDAIGRQCGQPGWAMYGHRESQD